jgi:hypothetical protein
VDAVSDLEPVAKIVRLPDARWAVENGAGVADLTLDDVREIIEAFRLWAGLLWERRGGTP